MNTEVHCPAGSFSGTVEGGVCSFHGIPYAKAPVGALRFRKPVPADVQAVPLDCTGRGKICPQFASDLDIPMGPTVGEQGEDCLNLAVSSPSLSGKAPVAVWFHGGANCYGGGDVPWYDGASLARSQRIVVVDISFRLGPFGFLMYPGLNTDNLAIEDQILALRWIRENIASFGGDPDRVTLFGQSAGGNAIAHILSRDDTEGLFSQVILESPSFGRGNHLMRDAFEVGAEVLRNLGIDPEKPEEIRGMLERKSADEILKAADAVSGEIRAKHQGMIFKPVMDAWHTPKQTAERTAEMAAKRGVRAAIGFMDNETHGFVLERDPETLKKLAEGQVARYEKPGQYFALRAAERGVPVYKYRFTWRPEDSIFNCCHCLELPFLFGNREAWTAPMLGSTSARTFGILKETFQSLWGTLFRFEEPDETVWPRYTCADRLTKIIDNEEDPAVREELLV